MLIKLILVNILYKRTQMKFISALLVQNIELNPDLDPKVIEMILKFLLKYLL